jgi:isoamylase
MGRWVVFFFLAVVCAPLVAALPCPLALLRLGSSFEDNSQALHFSLVARNAERVEVVLFDAPHGPPQWSAPLTRDSHGVWSISIAYSVLSQAQLMGPNAAKRPLYYGYRVWGPNWPYRAEWKPGTEIGFLEDVDALGNRFNPNKLLLDPYAQEVSHDPLGPGHQDESVYFSGRASRKIDTAPFAPKGIVLLPPALGPADGIRRAFRHEVIYEVHLRGFTQQDPSIPADERGTYRGAARKAAYLKSLGITAVEFLPVHEFQNALNSESSTDGNNYWGYMTHSYMAPDRRYATAKSQKEWGGVTREFREMVAEFHRYGIKVYLDVVFNHTNEGHPDPSGEIAKLLSFRGIDNRAYYQTAGKSYQDNSGCGPNLNCAHAVVRKLILDSLKYYRDMGVDGFRFDLASVLGNTFSEGHGFHFDKMPEASVLNQTIKVLPGRPAAGGAGVDLIAEPWAVNDATFQLGHFPFHPDKTSGWAEWNSHYRDTVRRSLNRLGHGAPTPGELALRIAGSSDHFEEDGRMPWHSVNFVTSHDGFTLWDLFSYNHPNNSQPAPYGPSDGGEQNNYAWDHHIRGETLEHTLQRRRQAARTAMALQLFSFGVPMILGGDEMLRSQRGNNNMWNVDASGSWLSWNTSPEQNQFREFTRNAIQLRHSHPELRPEHFLTGATDLVSGLRDIAWYQADGSSAEQRDLHPNAPSYMSDTRNHFLAYRLKSSRTSARSLYVAFFWGVGEQVVTLPPSTPGYVWARVLDTHADYEAQGNAWVQKPDSVLDGQYRMRDRSMAVFIERAESE